MTKYVFYQPEEGRVYDYANEQMLSEYDLQSLDKLSIKYPKMVLITEAEAETKILATSKYIEIGNEMSHNQKQICKLPHQKLKFD